MVRKALFILLLAYNNLLTLKAQHVPTQFDQLMGEAHQCATSKFRHSNRLATVTSAPEQDKYDLHYVNARWTAFPGGTLLNGRIVYHFKTLHSLDSFELDLADGMLVSQVLHRQQPLGWNHRQNRLRIGFPQTLSAQTFDSLEVSYSGIPVSTGFGSFYSDANRIHTLSQPYGARDWWPIKQGLSDKIDSLDVALAVPFDRVGVSNGMLTGHFPGGFTDVYTYRHRYPIAPYLVAIAVGPYTVHDTTLVVRGKNLRMEHHVYTDPPKWIEQMGNLHGMLNLFTDLFGEYPFIKEKYGHTEFAWGGGMEHQTNSFMGNYGFELTAHELAHMWFGDKVTCGTWSDIWLNEGFATWMSGLAIEKLLDPYWYSRWKWLQKDIVTHPVSGIRGSIYRTDTSSSSTLFFYPLTYAKAAAVLHQLRYQLGDDKLFPALKQYLQRPDLSYQFARTPDLKQTLELHTGADLTDYFQKWVYGEGYPLVGVSYRVNGRYVRTLTSQVPVNGAVGFFKMKFPLRFYNATRTDSADVWIQHQQNGQENQFGFNFEPDSVAFDPDNLVLARGSFTPLPEQGDPIVIIHQPNSKRILVQLTNSGNEMKRAWVTNVEGKQVLEVATSLSTDMLEVDLSNQQNGIYFLRLETSQGTIIRKVAVY